MVVKIEKKVDVMKKKIPKLNGICGMVTKYELRTPRELGAIRNLKKIISVNSLILSFKTTTGEGAAMKYLVMAGHV